MNRGRFDWTDRPALPIFPELRPHLEAAFDAAAEGEEFVLPRLRRHSNPGTTFKKVIQRAGIPPWPRPFNNCRSSRQTELADQFPAFVLDAWFGHDEKTAPKTTPSERQSCPKRCGQFWQSASVLARCGHPTMKTSDSSRENHSWPP